MIRIGFAVFLLALGAHADGFVPSPLRVMDEAVLRAQRPRINFTGAGVSCVDDAANARTNCTISGGGVGGANTAQVVVDFGAMVETTTRDTAETVVTGAVWVTGTSIIVCSLDNTVGTADHAAGDEDPIIEQLHVTVTALVVGDGWTMQAHAPESTWGAYVVNCTGA